MRKQFNLNAWAKEANPFPLFAQLREEEPVYWDAALKGWILTRYDDVRKTLRGPEYSSDRLRPFFESLPAEQLAKLPDLSTLIPMWLVFHAPPDHTRLRLIMSPAFTPAAITRMKLSIEKLVNELIDKFIDKGSVDFIHEFGLLLPGYVICDLLGVPREDLARIKKWSDDLQLFIGGAKMTPDKYARAQHGTHEMAEYFRAAICQKRKQPGDDLISGLVAARDNDVSISEDELISICILLIFGGHETTTNMLGNGLLAFIQHPEQLEKLRTNPELALSATEEVLRFDGPGGAVVRVAAIDHEVGGKTLRAGDRVFAMVPPANRDPRRFADPDRFDIERRDNMHLTFGQGPHFCLGAPLARLEATVAFPILFERLDNFKVQVAIDKLDWRDSTVMRGVHSLPLAFTRRRS